MSTEDAQATEITTREDEPRPRGRRPRWKSVVLELLLWTAVAVATAVFLIYAAERWLPSNF
jgi:hypothetical protein